MKKSVICRIVLAAVVMAAAGTAAAQGDLYRRYASRTDVNVSFIEAMRIDSATTVDVTVVKAVNPEGWSWMKSEFAIPDLTPELEAFLGPSAVSVHFSPSGHPEILAKVVDKPEGDAVVIDRAGRTVCIYHIGTVEQYRRILHRELDMLATADGKN